MYFFIHLNGQNWMNVLFSFLLLLEGVMYGVGSLGCSVKCLLFGDERCILPLCLV